ncbi:MAG: hypothetical protein C5B51_24640 [Terriglobia bacterium]|nr:MAG: hypothetical protein C5B51_24640 [Terriglobia bacterium]
MNLLPKLAILAAALSGAIGLAADFVSGLPIGATTQTIPVTDVTGPYKGEKICYVCDFDKAPDVLAFFRDTSDATAKEIIQLNDLYLKNKSRNFKAVAMMISGEGSRKWLEELNRSAHLEIPLTFLTKGPKDVAVRVYNLNPAVANTFLVTVDRTVVANISDIGPEQFQRVADATTEMLAGGK